MIINNSKLLYLPDNGKKYGTPKAQIARAVNVFQHSVAIYQTAISKVREQFMRLLTG